MRGREGTPQAVPLLRVDQDVRCLSRLLERRRERASPDVVSEIRWDGTTFAHLSPFASEGLLKSQWLVSIPVRLHSSAASPFHQPRNDVLDWTDI